MKTSMTIETGHRVSGDVQKIAGDRIRFVAADGNTMFEISCQEDGRSIEVRGVENCKVNKTLYLNTLKISPRYSNSILIETERYEP